MYVYHLDFLLAALCLWALFVCLYTGFLQLQSLLLYPWCDTYPCVVQVVAVLHLGICTLVRMYVFYACWYLSGLSAWIQSSYVVSNDYVYLSNRYTFLDVYFLILLYSILWCCWFQKIRNLYHCLWVWMSLEWFCTLQRQSAGRRTPCSVF